MKGDKYLKFLDFITPAGVKGNVADPSDLLKLVWGVVITIATLAIGQQVAKKVDNILPANTSNIEPFTKAQVTATNDGGVII